MIGIDTNLLVRFAANDHTAQSLAFQDKIRQLRKHDTKCFINIIVLCETIWVLKSRYGFEKAALIGTLDIFLASLDFVFEDINIVEEALQIFATSNVGLADILVSLRNQKAGCKTTLTFDKQAAKLNAFTLLK